MAYRIMALGLGLASCDTGSAGGGLLAGGDASTGTSVTPAGTTREAFGESVGETEGRAASSGMEGDGTTMHSVAPIRFDVGVGDPTGAPPDVCLSCSISLQTRASNALRAIDGNTFLAQAELFGHVVYAIDVVGSGRVLYTGDMTNVFYNEQTDCPLWPWLGGLREEMPRVLATGGQMCDAQEWNNLGALPHFTYAFELPDMYVGHPERLKDDYDVVMLCEHRAPREEGIIDAQTYVEYVRDHGGGLYMGSDYFLLETEGRVAAINAVANPLGASFEHESVNWGDAAAPIDVECLPTPAG